MYVFSNGGWMGTRYREIEVEGKPFEMGRQLGEAARDEIRGFVDVAIKRVRTARPGAIESASQERFLHNPG